MVHNLFCCVIVNLVNMAVKDNNIFERLQKLYRFISVGCIPVPVGGKVKERPVSENDNPGVFVEFFEVGLEPVELFLADGRMRVGDIIDGDKMNALVVENIVSFQEKFFEGLAVVEACIVLAC